MPDILDRYDLAVEELPAFYRRLNAEIAFPDGMVTSLGIVYWGRDQHMADLEKAIPLLRTAGIERFTDLWQAVRTKGRLERFAQRSGVSPGILRILKHDVELWLPRAVPLEQLDPFQQCPQYVERFARADIHDQLQVVSAGSTPPDRERLAQQTGLPLETVAEIVKFCDIYRLGTLLDSVRHKVYYDMGLDTWQKWAGLDAETIIAAFADHVARHDVEAVRQVPRPKEVRNGIAWAKCHLSVFEVEW